MRRYIQLDIWRYVRRNPGARARDIAAHVGSPVNSVSHSLKRMRDAGQMRREGVTHKSVWFVCGPKPECQYGLAVTSLANLKKKQEEWQAALRLALIAKGHDPDKPKPRRIRKARQYYTGTLEECWPASRQEHQ